MEVLFKGRDFGFRVDLAGLCSFGYTRTFHIFKLNERNEQSSFAAKITDAVSRC